MSDNKFKEENKLSVENQRNRDLLFKICFMHYITHILKILHINEEIVDILPTEIITLENKENPRIFDNFLDFQVITKSGKILIFEFKKNQLTTKDLKQCYEYFDRVHCKNNANVQLIIIVITDKGKITKYTQFDITYHPQIIKTKKINKQKDLSKIQNKFETNKKLNQYECSLLIALPLFQLNESEEEIVKEMCKNIKKKKDCIPENEIDKMTIAMYLNIIEYIEPEKQKEYEEMIDVSAKLEGELAKIEKKGIEKGEKNIIQKILKNYSNNDNPETLTIKKETLQKMLQK